MPTIPADIYRHIFDYCDVQTLSSCRLLNQFVLPIATTLVFQHMRLEAARSVNSFINVATSPLRHHTREITIDTWVGPQHYYYSNEPFHIQRDFFRALSYLRFFKNLKVLNLRFNKYCGRSAEIWQTYVEENDDFRYVVLDIAMRCLAGNWSAERQKSHEEQRLEAIGDDEGTVPTVPVGDHLPSDLESLGSIYINTFTISNLSDFNDSRLISGDAFKKVLSFGSLTSLKLLGTEEQDDGAPENSTWFPDRYEFFERMPHTWLAPSLAQNLQVLSLFFRDYWGWNPKMDFRAVNPGTGPNAGLPNLRVLALGNYVFSHDWQVDWIASLGKQNRSQGLEELYLDDCPIMWRARTLQVMDDSVTLIKLPDGTSLELSNSGYHRKDDFLQQGRFGHTYNISNYDYNLRWSQIIDHWRESMVALKMFRMGQGFWRGPPPETKLPYPYDTPEYNSDDPMWRPNGSAAQERYLQPRDGILHLIYDEPVGMSCKREHILKYIHFNIGMVPRHGGSKMDIRIQFRSGVRHIDCV
ncbi:hypothetical protein E8E14_011183 [Neopestalotiopsis sp. 37M]|nr:hypothetical protein E8E14_011183 [Neopestalotiopsis sp. 37M]